MDSTSIDSTEWKELRPTGPSWLFVPQDTDLLADYESGWSLRDIFAPGGDPAPGIVTTHDEFAISWTPEEAAQKVECLLATNTEGEARERFKLCSQDQWRYERAKAELADGAWREKIVPILYRPFDVRWTVYDRNVAVHRRERASDNMLRDNLALCTTRATEISRGWEHVWISNGLIQHHTVSIKEVNYLFPLWRYTAQVQADLLAGNAVDDKHTNLSPEFVAALSAAVGRTPKSGDVLAWIYSVLFAPSYRASYREFLKRDFPRVPLPRNCVLFDRLVELGQELIDLHTMQKARPRVTRYDIAGSNEVMTVGYRQGLEVLAAQADSAGDRRNAACGRVYINDAQYFDGVSEAAWNFHIGGYRVLEKWLKDRKGRCLSYDDLTHYQAVVSAVVRTLELQSDLDEVIEKAGGWSLK